MSLNMPKDPTRLAAQYGGNLGRTLRLSDREAQALGRVRPELLVQFCVSVLGGDELSNAPRIDMLRDVDAPALARPALGKVVSLEGQDYLDYRKGAAAERLRALYAKSDPGSRSRYETVCRTSAEFVHGVMSTVRIDSDTYGEQMPRVPQMYIVSDKAHGSGVRLRVPSATGDDVSYHIDRPLTNVATFGPGMTGAFLAANLVGRTKQITYASGGFGADFVNGYIQLQHDTMNAGMAGFRASGKRPPDLGRDVSLSDLHMPEAFYYSDGIAAAVGKLLMRQRVDGEGPLDLALMSAVHSAGQAECETGIAGAATLLGDGGLLAIKAPRVSVGQEAGMDFVGPIADNLFGAPVLSGYAGTGPHPLDPATRRDMDYAIYQR